MSWNNDNDKSSKEPSKGPWGSRDEPRRPEPQRPYGGDDLPDIDKIIRQRLGGLLGGGKGGLPGGEKKSIGFILLILFAFWAATGLYITKPGENGVLLTFGNWTSTRSTSGLGYHIPWPVQQVIPVNVAFEQRLEVGRHKQRGGGTDESRMLTGDENIVDIDFVVMWKVSNAEKYLFRIRDPEATVKKVAESAMRETIGQSQIQKVLTEGRADIEVKTKDLMQRMLDAYESGIVINSVQMQSVDPPDPVVDAFDDVQRARADMERTKNEAETYQNDIVPRARGDAKKILQDAEAYKQAAIDKAKGAAGRFDSVYAAYSKARNVTEKRIYIETMEKLLKSSKNVVLTDGKGTNVMPWISQGGAYQGSPPPQAAPMTAAQ